MKIFNKAELNGGNIKYICEKCSKTFYSDKLDGDTCPHCNFDNDKEAISKELFIFADCFSYHNGKPDQMAGFCSIITNDRFELDDSLNIECVIRKAFLKKTNNYGELMGILYGLEYLINEEYPHVYDVIHIISDSEYAILGARERMYNWKKKGWKNSCGTVKNLELWKKVYEDVQILNNLGVKLDFIHQKGHIGKTVSKEENHIVYLQEKCDSLAVDLKNKIIKGEK